MPRLRRSDTSAPGFTRRRAGLGFTYRDESGQTIRDREVVQRIRDLVIPPAWRDVWICPHPNGHIQATGTDDAGRRQYLYHPQWRAQRDRVKFDRALELAATLPAARARVTRELRAATHSRARALAAAFRMLDTGSLRVGSEAYAEANGSVGLCTLDCAHARVDGDTVTLEFPAKSGQAWSSTIIDPDLASVVNDLQQHRPDPCGTAGERLLCYPDDTGEWRALTPAEVNGYVRERTGGDFTSKDFRTLHGTIAAAESLARQGVQSTKTARTRAVAQAMRDAAEALGNTPAIARASYVDPRVVDLYQAGTTIEIGHTSAEKRLRELLA